MAEQVRLEPHVDPAEDDALAAVTPAPSFLARHPERPVLYAVNEMAPAGRLSAWAIGPGSTLRPLGTVSSGGGDPCHLLVHPAGRALYACNYASGTVATVLLEPAGGFDPMALERGEPTVVLGHHGTGPERARQEGPHAHFAVEVGRMIVANQTGGGLAALALGEPRSADGHAPAEHAQAGIPTVLGRLDLPSPACVISGQSA